MLSSKQQGQDDSQQWDAFLTSKRQALNRMKAGRQEALRRLGSERTHDSRSILSQERSVLSDERDPASETSQKENAGGGRDLGEVSRENPASIHNENRKELDVNRLVEIFTSIEKRRWEDLMEHLNYYPRAAAFPCPKNLRTSTKGNLMLHEACRNNPPLKVVDVLINAYGDAAKAKGGKGYLPIHYACATGASAEVIERLINIFPASIRTRDTNDLMIPLHFACKWGAQSDVIELLIRTYPEGKQVRDIYAKTPNDYATELGDEREVVLASLGRSLSQSGSEVSSINLNDEPSDANKQLRRELASAKSKLKKLTKDLNERERKFSLLYGAEKDKAFELHKQKELLENECLQAKMIQDEQAKQIKLLEQEFKNLKSLQETHDQKRSMLEEKISTLEKEKLELEQKGNGMSFRIKEELVAAMKDQETKYKSMLEAEQAKIRDLETRSKEAEMTHRHYTMALLQEHEKEVSKFEELTSRFKVLESQLRREIENERTKRIQAQKEADSKGSEFKQALVDEKEKVAFLEGHIGKVNDLLEAEQKRFYELEEILKETLSLENEQREELEAEFKEKEAYYQQRIETEVKNKQQLESAYAEVTEKLKFEIQKSVDAGAYESGLKRELEADQAKIDELQKSQEESKRLLEEEQERARKLQEASEEAQEKLKAEQAKVQELEKSNEKMQLLLEMERASAASLRDELKELQMVYEKEMKKVRDAQQKESSARSELRSLSQRVSSLEEEEEMIKTKAETDSSRLQTAQRECELLQSMLESERDRVDTLTRSQEELRELLDAEKQKVKVLEQAQAVQEGQAEGFKSQVDTNDETIEAQLIQSQNALNGKRNQLSELEGEILVLNRQLDDAKKSVAMLEGNVNQRDAFLKLQREKFEALLKEHADIQAELNKERKQLETAKEEVQMYRDLLEVEQDTVKDLQQMVDQAKVDFESKMEEIRAMEEDNKANISLLDSTKKELEAAKDEVEKLTESLKLEKQKIEVMSVEHEDLKAQLEKEKEKVAELEQLLEAQKDLSIADQSTIQQLEKKIESLEAENGGPLGKLQLELSEAKTLLEVRSEKLMKLEEEHTVITNELDEERKKAALADQDLSRKDVLLESEQNKVKALEESCEQLMSLLDWEKKHVLSLRDKQNELEDDLEANHEEMAELKKNLENSEKLVKKLTSKLENFDGMRREIIRLTTEAKQRDVMMAAMLHSVGEATAIRGKAPIQKAEIFVNDRERVLGLDLAGLDDAVVMDRNRRALVTYDDAARLRALGKVVIPLIPIGGLYAYHQHDPALLRGLSANIGEISSSLRTNIGDLSANFGGSLREPVVQMVGMAAQRMNIRRVG